MAVLRGILWGIVVLVFLAVIAAAAGVAAVGAAFLGGVLHTFVG